MNADSCDRNDESTASGSARIFNRLALASFIGLGILGGTALTTWRTRHIEEQRQKIARNFEKSKKIHEEMDQREAERLARKSKNTTLSLDEVHKIYPDLGVFFREQWRLLEGVDLLYGRIVFDSIHEEPDGRIGYRTENGTQCLVTVKFSRDVETNEILYDVDEDIEVLEPVKE